MGATIWEPGSPAAVPTSFIFQQPLTGSVPRTFQNKVQEVVSLPDFGGDPTGVLDATAALVQAASDLNAIGGGIVYMPGVYKISNYTHNYANVTLQGDRSGYAYDAMTQSHGIVCTAGVFAIRIPSTSQYAVLRDLTISSNGALDTANALGGFPIITPGVEYGVVIETGATLLERVCIQGFQYGAGIPTNGNNNIFDKCAFVWNTKVGFFVTSAALGVGNYTCFHPNLTTAGVVFNPTTQVILRNCIIRRNGWGAILRDGSGFFDATLFESNFFGAVYGYIGTLDTGVNTWIFNNICRFENNWAGFALANAYTINQNRLFQETLGLWIPWTITGVRTTTDAGYQINLASVAVGTAAGPNSWKFIDTQATVIGEQKLIWFKSSYHVKFIDGQWSSAVGSDAIRLNAGTGGWYANVTGFENAGFALPPTGGWGNRGYWWQLDGGGRAGYNWLVGCPKTVDNTYVATITNGDMTVNGINGVIGVVSDGLTATLTIPDPSPFTGVSAAVTFRINGAMPTLAIPSGTRYANCFCQDNTGAFVAAQAKIDNTGLISLFANGNRNAFTAAGTKTLQSGTITYPL